MEPEIIVKTFVFVGVMVGGFLFGLWYQGKLALLIPMAGAAILVAVVYAGGPENASPFIRSFVTPIGMMWTITIIRWLIPRRYRLQKYGPEFRKGRA